LISCQGHFFQANEVESALRSVPDVSEPSVEWQMTRPAGELENKPLQVRVERGISASADNEDIAGRVRIAIQDSLGVETIVEVLDRETLPRAGYKAARVIDP
jgi:phenylacetate-coenzyme A ligase PaaK-like adenylate-forming protein